MFRLIAFLKTRKVNVIFPIEGQTAADEEREREETEIYCAHVINQLCAQNQLERGRCHCSRTEKRRRRRSQF